MRYLILLFCLIFSTVSLTQENNQDNSSNALGFLCAWVLIYFSNNENEIIAPVTALWLVAIPFVDAVGVIISRLLKKLKVLNSYRLSHPL